MVGVMEHKTAAQQVAMFALDQEEEMVNSKKIQLTGFHIVLGDKTNTSLFSTKSGVIPTTPGSDHRFLGPRGVWRTRIVAGFSSL